MKLEQYVTGIQHLGIPVKNMELTLAFYRKLGFEEACSATNHEKRVMFIKQKNLVIELYEEEYTAEKPGAIDHVALDVTDIEQAFELARDLGFELLDSKIQFLPFWERGVRFFTVMGPNGEKVEFSQRL